jgi:hypothetical protein
MSKTGSIPLPAAHALRKLGRDYDNCKSVAKFCCITKIRLGALASGAE